MALFKSELLNFRSVEKCQICGGFFWRGGFKMALFKSELLKSRSVFFGRLESGTFQI